MCLSLLDPNVRDTCRNKELRFCWNEKCDGRNKPVTNQADVLLHRSHVSFHVALDDSRNLSQSYPKSLI